jgi:hypothetical protein
MCSYQSSLQLVVWKSKNKFLFSSTADLLKLFSLQVTLLLMRDGRHQHHLQYFSSTFLAQACQWIILEGGPYSALLCTFCNPQVLVRELIKTDDR